MLKKHEPLHSEGPSDALGSLELTQLPIHWLTLLGQQLSGSQQPFYFSSLSYLSSICIALWSWVPATFSKEQAFLRLETINDTHGLHFSLLVPICSCFPPSSGQALSCLSAVQTYSNFKVTSRHIIPQNSPTAPTIM